VLRAEIQPFGSAGSAEGCHILDSEDQLYRRLALLHCFSRAMDKNAAAAIFVHELDYSVIIISQNFETEVFFIEQYRGLEVPCIDHDGCELNGHGGLRYGVIAFAAVTSTSTRNSARVKPPTTIRVETGLGSSV